MTTKIALNKCYGGFSITEECLALYNKLSGLKLKYCGSIERDDKNLITAIETIGEKKASGALARIEIEEVMSGYEITEYDGCEDVEYDDDY